MFLKSKNNIYLFLSFQIRFSEWKQELYIEMSLKLSRRKAEKTGRRNIQVLLDHGPIYKILITKFRNNSSFPCILNCT